MKLFQITKLAKVHVDISFDMVFDINEKKLKQCFYRYLQTMFYFLEQLVSTLLIFVLILFIKQALCSYSHEQKKLPRKVKVWPKNYRGWLRKYGLCYNTTKWSSFLNTRPSYFKDLAKWLEKQNTWPSDLIKGNVMNFWKSDLQSAIYIHIMKVLNSY